MLSKYRRAKKQFIRTNKAFTGQDIQDLQDQKEINRQLLQETSNNASRARRGKTIEQCCRLCKKFGYNARTCKKNEKQLNYLYIAPRNIDRAHQSPPSRRRQKLHKLRGATTYCFQHGTVQPPFGRANLLVMPPLGYATTLLCHHLVVPPLGCTKGQSP